MTRYNVSRKPYGFYFEIENTMSYVNRIATKIHNAYCNVGALDYSVLPAIRRITHENGAWSRGKKRQNNQYRIRIARWSFFVIAADSSFPSCVVLILYFAPMNAHYNFFLFFFFFWTMLSGENGNRIIWSRYQNRALDVVGPVFQNKFKFERERPLFCLCFWAKRREK